MADKNKDFEKDLYNALNVLIEKRIEDDNNEKILAQSKEQAKKAKVEISKEETKDNAQQREEDIQKDIDKLNKIALERNNHSTHTNYQGLKNVSEQTDMVIKDIPKIEQHIKREVEEDEVTEFLAEQRNKNFEEEIAKANADREAFYQEEKEKEERRQQHIKDYYGKTAEENNKKITEAFINGEAGSYMKASEAKELNNMDNTKKIEQDDEFAEVAESLDDFAEVVVVKQDKAAESLDDFAEVVEKKTFEIKADKTEVEPQAQDTKESKPVIDESLKEVIGFDFDDDLFADIGAPIEEVVEVSVKKKLKQRAKGLNPEFDSSYGYQEGSVTPQQYHELYQSDPWSANKPKSQSSLEIFLKNKMSIGNTSYEDIFGAYTEEGNVSVPGLIQEFVSRYVNQEKREVILMKEASQKAKDLIDKGQKDLDWFLEILLRKGITPNKVFKEVVKASTQQEGPSALKQKLDGLRRAPDKNKSEMLKILLDEYKMTPEEFKTYIGTYSVRSEFKDEGQILELKAIIDKFKPQDQNQVEDPEKSEIPGIVQRLKRITEASNADKPVLLESLLKDFNITLDQFEDAIKEQKIEGLSDTDIDILKALTTQMKGKKSISESTQQTRLATITRLKNDKKELQIDSSEDLEKLFGRLDTEYKTASDSDWSKLTTEVSKWLKQKPKKTKSTADEVSDPEPIVQKQPAFESKDYQTAKDSVQNALKGDQNNQTLEYVKGKILEELQKQEKDQSSLDQNKAEEEAKNIVEYFRNEKLNEEAKTKFLNKETIKNLKIFNKDTLSVSNAENIGYGKLLESQNVLKKEADLLKKSDKQEDSYLLSQVNSAIKVIEDEIRQRETKASKDVSLRKYKDFYTTKSDQDSAERLFGKAGKLNEMEQALAEYIKIQKTANKDYDYTQDDSIKSIVGVIRALKQAQNLVAEGKLSAEKVDQALEAGGSSLVNLVNSAKDTIKKDKAKADSEKLETARKNIDERKAKLEKDTAEAKKKEDAEAVKTYSAKVDKLLNKQEKGTTATEFITEVNGLFGDGITDLFGDKVDQNIKDKVLSSREYQRLNKRKEQLLYIRENYKDSEFRNTVEQGVMRGDFSSFAKIEEEFTKAGESKIKKQDDEEVTKYKGITENLLKKIQSHHSVDVYLKLLDRLENELSKKSEYIQEEVRKSHNYQSLQGRKDRILYAQGIKDPKYTPYANTIMQGIMTGKYTSYQDINDAFARKYSESKELKANAPQMEYKISKLKQELQKSNLKGTDKQEADILEKNIDKLFSESNALINANKVDEAKKKVADLNSEITKLNILLGKTKDAQKEVEKAQKELADKLKIITSTIQQSIDGIVKTITNATKLAVKYVKSVFTVVQSGVKIIQRLIQLFGNLGNRVKNASHSNSLFSKSWTEINSKISMFERAYRMITNNRFIDSANKVYSSIASLAVISSDASFKVVNFAESLEEKLGISADRVLQSISELSTTIYGLGINADQVAMVSENLVMVGQSFAKLGVMGGNYDQIISKITSGLRGMVTAIDDLGISVREATQKELLKRLKEAPESLLSEDQLNPATEEERKELDKFISSLDNLSETYDSLTEAQRITLRTYSILTQYQDKYGDSIELMQKYMNTSIGKMNNLKEAATSLVTTIGKSLYTVFSTVAPYIEWVIRKLTTLIQTFTEGLGIFKSSKDAANEYADALSNTTEVTDKNTESEEENSSAKQNNSLLSFDKITVLNDANEASEKVDLSYLLGKFGELEDSLASMENSYIAELEKRVKEGIAKLKENVQTFVDDLMGRHIDLTFGFKKDESVEALEATWANLKETAKTIGNTFLYSAISIADYAQLGATLTDILKLFEKISELIKNITVAVADGIKLLIDSNSGAISDWGDRVRDKIKGITAEVQSLSNFAKYNRGLITLAVAGDEAAQARLDEVLTKFFKVRPVLLFMYETAKRIYDVVSKAFEFLKTAYNLIIKPLIKDTLVFLSETVLPYISEQLEFMNQYLEGNAEFIKDVVKSLREIAWQIIRIAVTTIKMALQWIADHKELILKVLEGITKMLKWIEEHPGAIKTIITMVLALKLLGKTLNVLGNEHSWINNISKVFTGKTLFQNIGPSMLKVIKPVGKAITTFIKGIPSKIAGVIPKIVSMISGSVGATVATVVVSAVSAALGVGNAVSDFVEAYETDDEEVKKKKLKTGSSKAGMVVAGAAIGSAAGPLGTLIGAGIGGLLTFLPDWVHELIVNLFIAVFKGIWKLITEWLPSLFGTLWGYLVRFYTWVTSLTWDDIKALGEKLLETLSNLWNDIVTWFEQALTNMWINFRNAKNKASGETVTNADGSTTTTKKDGTVINTYANGVSKTTKKDGTVILVSTDGTVTTINPDGTETAEKAEISALEVLGHGATGAAIGAKIGTVIPIPGAGLVLGTAGFVAGALTALPKYGEGGIIDEHQIAELGEDGKEIVIPLSQAKRQRGLELWQQAASYLGVDNLQSKMSELTSIKSIPNLAAYSNGGTFKNGQLTINNESVIKLLGDLDTPIQQTSTMNEDMQQVMYMAVYNALAKFMGDNPNLLGTTGTQELNITGPVFFKDKTAMREFARMLAPYLKQVPKVDSNLDYRMA